MKIPIVGSNPDRLTVARRLAARVDRRVHFGIRIVHRHAAGLLLLLLLRIMGGEIRRNAVPRLSMIARAEQELRANVNRALLIRAHVDRRVPVEAQLPFSVILFRLDQTAF